MAFPKPWLAAFLLVLCFTGCSAAVTAEPAPEASATQVGTASVTPKLRASATALPSPTTTRPPKATIVPPTAPVFTHTPAPSATPAAAYDELKVLAVNNRVGGWLVTLSVPGVTRAQRMSLGGNTYDCSVDAQYPDRLFCQGLVKPPFDAQMKLAFLDPQSGQVLYQSNLVIPTALLVPPTLVGWPETGCEQRGQNVSCEVECRIAPNGSPCIVATCVDACGPYFSVHTCPDMSLDFVSCNPEQWARMKALYQIP
jgi:hypothetical protein